jgi:hypothetical protein
MVVMLDVGNLPPGSYRVGIGDSRLAMAGANSPTVGTQRGAGDVRRNRFNRPGEPGNDTDIDQHRNIQPPGVDRGIVPFNQSKSRNRRTSSQPQSAPATGGVDQRQGSVAPGARLIPSTILAQVIDEVGSGSGAAAQTSPSATPSTGQVNRPGTPPTGQVLPPGTPPTGQVLRPGTPPTGQVLPPGTPPTGRVSPATPIGDNNGNIAGTSFGPQGLDQFGMLTIDQSGTGRMQQVVGGVRVRDVVGQALVIYASGNQPTTTVPPNANTSGTALRNQPGATQRGSQNTQQVPPNAAGQPQLPAGNQAQLGATAGSVAGSGIPVAAGIIQMMAPRAGGQGPVQGTDAAGTAVDGTADPTGALNARPAQGRQPAERRQGTQPRQRNATPQPTNQLQ